MSVAAMPAAGSLGEHLRRLIRTQALPAVSVEFARRDVVYSCRGDGDIYLVERGQVKSVVVSRDGKDCLIGIYTAGDVLGESCLLGGGREETVTAMTATVLTRISSRRMLAALDDAGLREGFVRYLAGRVIEQQRLITDLITADSEYRLATVLLHLGNKLGIRDELACDAQVVRIETRITQEELSGMVGTTRSRIGFFLKRFCHAGLVSRGAGGRLILNESRLNDYLSSGKLWRAAPVRRLGDVGRVKRRGDQHPDAIDRPVQPSRGEQTAAATA